MSTWRPAVDDEQPAAARLTGQWEAEIVDAKPERASKRRPPNTVATLHTRLASLNGFSNG